MIQPTVVDQPAHDDRALVEGRLADRHVRAGPLEDPPAADRRSPAWPTSPSGASATGSCRCRSTRRGCAQHKVTLDPVVTSAGNALWSSPLTFVEASTPGTGGFIDTANQRLEIQHIQPVRTAADLAQVAVDGAEQQGLRLGDVATVVEDHQPLIGDGLANDEPEPAAGGGAVPGHERLAGHPGRRGGARPAGARPARDHGRHQPSTGRPASSTPSATTSAGRWSSAWSCWAWCSARCLPAGGGRRWSASCRSRCRWPWRRSCCPGRASRLNVMVVAGLVVAVAVVADDAAVGALLSGRRPAGAAEDGPDGRLAAAVGGRGPAAGRPRRTPRWSPSWRSCPCWRWAT